jgi:amino acid transporter
VRIGVIANRSPLAGLREDRLSLAEVLAQSMAAVAPTAAAVTLPILVIAMVGGLAIPIFLAATGLVLMVGYCLTHFARRMTSASGLYSYTAKGLGPVPAFLTGWSSILGYAAAAMASALQGGVYLARLLEQLGVSEASSRLGTSLCIVTLSVTAALVLIRGVALSARLALTLEALSVGLVIAVLGMLAAGRPSASIAPLAETPELATMTTATLLAVMAFVGFESAGTLGVETRRPFRTLPQALVWTPLLLAAIYLGAVVLQQLIFEDHSGSILSSSIPVADLVAAEQRTILSVLLDIGILTSWFACLVGSSSAMVRIMFSMGRERVLPAWFGRTHRRFGTPHAAVGVVMPVLAGVTLILIAAGVSLTDALVAFLTLSAFGYLVSYSLVCLAAPLFLHRLGELTRVPLVVGIATFGLTAFLVVWTVLAQTVSNGGVGAVYLVLMGAGVLWLAILQRRDPGRLDGIGVYDEPVVDDLLDQSYGWGRG